jgi:hypothetical protein
MTAEQVLSYVTQKGVILTADGDCIQYRAPVGIMTPDLAEMIRIHKQGILGILNLNKESKNCLPFDYGGNRCFSPGDCEKCPACGYWDWHGPGLWCFYHAYFLGKSGHPIRSKTAKENCPLSKSLNYKVF